MNKYIDKIRAYEESKNISGVYYIYSMMFRKIFIFEKPEFEDFSELSMDNMDYNPDGWGGEGPRNDGTPNMPSVGSSLDDLGDIIGIN